MQGCGTSVFGVRRVFLAGKEVGGRKGSPCFLKHGARRGVILGCMEIGLFVQPEDVDTPLFDTARIAAKEAMTYVRT